MVFKRESVVERLKALQEVLARLSSHQGLSLEEYLSKPDIQWIVERGLILAAAIIFDIGDHILSSVFSVSAEEYEEILEKLSTQRVISNELWQELRGMGGFRNILVHGYLEINAALVYHNFQEAMRAFPQFIAEIEQWLSKFQQHK